jgi:hypothetical protein
MAQLGRFILQVLKAFPKNQGLLLSGALERRRAEEDG